MAIKERKLVSIVYVIICYWWTCFLYHINFVIIFETITQQSEHESMGIDFVTEFEYSVRPLDRSKAHKTLIGNLVDIR